MAIDEQSIARFGELLSAALPAAISEAFGGAAQVDSHGDGILPLLVMELGEGYHLHLELEGGVGRLDNRKLVIVLRPEDATRLFDLEPTPEEQYGDAETQLRLLGEFTEGAEALAGALAAALSAAGPVVTLHVSGASLEDASNSPATASLPLEGTEDVAYALILAHPPGPEMTFVIGAAADFATALALADSGVGGTDDRAASLAARVASRQQEPSAAPTFTVPPLAPPPAAPAMAAMGAFAPPGAAPMPAAAARPAPTAHPFAFGQLETPAPAHRQERSVDLILDVSLNVRVELGSTHMTVEEVLALGPGSVVELDRLAGEPVDIVVNDRLIARGEVVVVEENFGVRVTEIVTARGRAHAA